MHVATDFSYRNNLLASPCVLRAGDASGFIDPIFSSSVLLAMTSGQQSAQAVHEAITLGQPLTKGMQRYEKDNRYRISQYWEFIENFYRLHFAQLFFQPHPRMRMLCSINAVLAGCTSLSFSAWWRLRLFFLSFGSTSALHSRNASRWSDDKVADCSESRAPPPHSRPPQPSCFFASACGNGGSFAL